MQHSESGCICRVAVGEGGMYKKGTTVHECMLGNMSACLEKCISPMVPLVRLV